VGENKASTKQPTEDSDRRALSVRIDLARLLKRQKWSLKELERRTGITYSSLHDHAHGRTEGVTFPILLKLKKVFNVTWDDLFKVS